MGLCSRDPRSRNRCIRANDGNRRCRHSDRTPACPLPPTQPRERRTGRGARSLQRWVQARPEWRGALRLSCRTLPASARLSGTSSSSRSARALRTRGCRRSSPLARVRGCGMWRMSRRSGSLSCPQSSSLRLSRQGGTARNPKLSVMSRMSDSTRKPPRQGE